MKSLKSQTHQIIRRPNPLPKLSTAVLLLVSMCISTEAATYEVNLGGTLNYMSGSHWDSTIQLGTPFSLSLTYSTPPPETYDSNGYSTYVYRNASASMSYQIGTNLFLAGRVDLSVWNDMSWSGSRIDGYHLFTDTGSSPGFDFVQFYVALQSSNTNLLANNLLPLCALPLTYFDRLALAALNVNFTGHSYPDSLGYLEGSITSFRITEVPEPSAIFLALPGVLLMVWRNVAKRASITVRPFKGEW